MVSAYINWKLVKKYRNRFLKNIVDQHIIAEDVLWKKFNTTPWLYELESKYNLKLNSW